MSSSVPLDSGRVTWSDCRCWLCGILVSSFRGFGVRMPPPRPRPAQFYGHSPFELLRPWPDPREGDAGRRYVARVPDHALHVCRRCPSRWGCLRSCDRRTARRPSRLLNTAQWRPKLFVRVRRETRDPALLRTLFLKLAHSHSGRRMPVGRCPTLRRRALPSGRRTFDFLALLHEVLHCTRIAFPSAGSMSSAFSMTTSEYIHDCAAIGIVDESLVARFLGRRPGIVFCTTSHVQHGLHHAGIRARAPLRGSRSTRMSASPNFVPVRLFGLPQQAVDFVA